MKIDLHSHSFYSDGVLSPSEVVKLASQAGCELFSLTDHDTTEGSEEAKLEADKLTSCTFVPFKIFSFVSGI